MKKVLKFIWKLIKWLLIAVVSVFLLIAAAIHIPAVQNYLIQKSTDYFNQQTGGELSVKEIDLRIPFYVQLEGVSLKDPRNKKIASIGSFKLGIGWRKIFQKTISLDDIYLKDVDAFIQADGKGVWNYGFIIDGFTEEDTKSEKSSESAAWDISFSKIRLKNINFNYKNAQSADTLQTEIGSFYANFQRVSVLNQVYLIDKADLSYTNTYFSMGSGSDEEEEEEQIEKPQSEMLVSIKTLKINDVESYANIPGTGIFDVKIGQLDLLVKKLNLDINQYLIDEFKLSNSRASVYLEESKSEKTAEYTPIFQDLNLVLKKFELANNHIRVELENDSLSHNVDLNKLALSKISADSTHYAVEIDGIALKYNEYPELRDWKGSINLTDRQLAIKNLQIFTNHSELVLHAKTEYSSFQSFVSDYIIKRASVNVNKLKLGQADLNAIKNQFLPKDSFPDFESDILIDALLTSNSANLALAPLNIKYGESSLNIQAEKYNLDISDYSGEISSLTFKLGNPLTNQVVRSTTLDGLKFPESIELVLQGKNYRDSANAHLNILTSVGDIEMISEVNLSDTTRIPLRAQVKSEALKVGEILTDSPDAFIQFNLDATTQNILKYDSLTHVYLSIDSLFYEVPVKNIQADLNILNGVYKSDIAIRDTFIDSDMHAEVKLSDTLVSTAQIEINGIDFQGLGLSKTDIRGKTKLTLGYNQNENFQSGELEISNTLFVKENENYDLSPSLAKFYLDKDTTDIEISGLINLYSRSNRSASKIFEKLPGLISQTYARNDDSTAIWIAELEVGELPVFRELFLPELTGFSGMTGKVDYKSSEGRIDAEISLPKLIYNSLFVDSLHLTTGSDSSMAEGILNVKRLGYDTLKISNLGIVSKDAKNQTEISIQTQRNLTSPPNYLVNLIFQPDSGQKNRFTLHLVDTLLLNDEVWSIDQGQFHFADSTSYGNIAVSRAQERIGFFSEELTDEFTIHAENFELGNLLSITQEDSLVSGAFSGSITSTKNSFKGVGKIDSFSILRAELGDLSWDITHGEQTALKVHSENGRLSFHSEGIIDFPKDTPPQLDIQTQLNNLDLKAIAELYPQYVLDADGMIHGRIDLSGTIDDPLFNGTFQIEPGYVHTVYTGNNLRIQPSKIDLTNNKINLNTIALRDSLGNELTVTGEINDYLEDISNVDISIHADDFTLVNTSPENGVLVYGKLIADLDIDITQRLDAPKIKATIKITNGTDFTYKVPPDDDYETFDDDIIEWTNLDTVPDRDEILKREKDKLNAKVDVFANTVDFNGEVQIVEEANLRVLIDSAAGDFLEIRGDAKISMKYDRAGNLRMVGNYYVADGFYQMNFYNLSKKKFNFKEGGYVNWNGDAFNPNLNLSAVYTTRATLSNLMMTESNSTVNPAYQQSLPFDVIMSIAGEVENPDIAFDIQLSDENKGALNGAVDSRLSILRREESELNKQVFALLVFQTFMPAGSTNSPNLVENQARSSASQILSQELNKYGDQLIKGVDVNFDLQSYGGAQGQGNTDLSVDVAKSFFDNRVVVKVGSTIALEQNINTGNNDPFNTNVVVEYLITRDGRYRFLGYSKTNLEDIVVGRITRTGAGLVYQRDFDRFRYLLNPKSNPDYLKKEERKPEEELKEEKEAE